MNLLKVHIQMLRIILGTKLYTDKYVAVFTKVDNLYQEVEYNDAGVKVKTKTK